MENIQSSSVSNPIQEVINTPVSNIQTNEKRPFNILVMILLVIVLLQSGLLVYLFLTERIVLNESVLEEESTSLEESEDIYEEDTIKEEEPTLLTYTFDNSKMATGYTFKYPNDWEITTQDTTCGIDPVSNTEICTNHRLILSYIDNPSYYISLEMCSECSPGFTCIFPDSVLDEEFLNMGETFNVFEEFDDGNFRRGVVEGGNEEELTICKYSDTQEFQNLYHSSLVNGMNSVVYGIGNEPDESILEVMDSIVISLENI